MTQDPKAERQQRWQQHFDDYCVDNFGGREPSGREYDQAAAHADWATDGEDE